jgi:hypothetical protein
MASLFRISLKFVFTAVLAGVVAASIPAQDAKTPKPTPEKPQPTPTTKGIQKPSTAEQVIQTSSFIYTGGRALDQIRKTTTEHGRATIMNAEGRPEQSTYQRYIIRGETLDKERIRIDQKFPTAEFSLVFGGDKTFGIFNNTIFTPREDAVKNFENQIYHSIDAFLRFKAPDYTAELADNQKIYGVEFYVVDLTDKQGRKTRYFVSAKTFRIMMLTYDEAGVRYRRKFYDYNYAQGTLVPFRSVLWANEKQIEETEIGTITYGQKVDEELFKAG